MLFHFNSHEFRCFTLSKARCSQFLIRLHLVSLFSCNVMHLVILQKSFQITKMLTVYPKNTLIKSIELSAMHLKQKCFLVVSPKDEFSWIIGTDYCRHTKKTLKNATIFNLIYFSCWTFHMDHFIRVSYFYICNNCE